MLKITKKTNWNRVPVNLHSFESVEYILHELRIAKICVLFRPFMMKHLCIYCKIFAYVCVKKNSEKTPFLTKLYFSSIKQVNISN